MLKFDSKRITVMIVATSILMAALACGADETKQTPAFSNDGTVSQSVAPTSANDDISITRTKLPRITTLNESSAQSSEPAPVAVDSKSESYATVQSSPVPSAPGVVSSSVARETPHGQLDLPASVETEDEVAVVEPIVDQTPEIDGVEPSATPEPAIAESESVEHDVTANETVALTISQAQVQLEPVEPEQEPTPPPLQTPAVTPEPTPTSTPAPEPEPPTPEPVTVAVTPTSIPVTFGTEIGDIAHPFRLPSVDGLEYRLEDQKGRSVVLVFYRAYW